MLPVALTLMLAAAVQIPVLLVPAIGLLTFAWVQRDRWAWPRWQRRTRIVHFSITAMLNDTTVGGGSSCAPLPPG